MSRELIAAPLRRVLEEVESAERKRCEQARHGEETMFAETIAQKETKIVNLMAENARMREILKHVDHTLSVHGHIDANTELHKRVQAILED